MFIKRLSIKVILKSLLLLVDMEKSSNQMNDYKINDGLLWQNRYPLSLFFQ